MQSSPALLPGDGGPRLIEAVRKRRAVRSGMHQAWRVRVATACLWALIALAATGGLRSLIAPPPPAAPTRTSPAAAGPVGFAELYVAAYLEAGAGQEQSLKPFYGGHIDLQSVAPSSRYASRTAAVAAAETAPGYWAITVGAEVLVAAQGGYVRSGTHYFQVGVLAGPGGVVATSLPGEVPAPPAVAPPQLDVPALGMPQDDPVSKAVSRFLGAYLSGGGDPGGGIRAITPPPFASVSLTGIAASPPGPTGRRTVLAEVAGTDAGGLREILDYSLRIMPRQDGWAVEAVLADAPLGVDR